MLDNTKLEHGFVLEVLKCYVTRNLNMAVFWVVAPCSLVEVYRSFRGVAASIIRATRDRPDDGGRKHI
jgi:hypothetical protein